MSTAKKVALGALALIIAAWVLGYIDAGAKVEVGRIEVWASIGQ